MSSYNIRSTKGGYAQLCRELKECPLCDLRSKYVIVERPQMVLTTNLYPYTDGHLMIVPKRHIENFRELSRAEWEQAFDLFKIGLQGLREELGLSDVWLLYREGKKSAKTVGHLHFHLLPYKKGLVDWHYQNILLPPEKLARRLRESFAKA